MLRKSNRLLLVEDDDSHAEIFSYYATQALPDLKIDRMSDGEEAVSFFKKHMSAGEAFPELIVLDLNLPRYNGHEILEIIRGHCCAGRIPVIILSSSANVDDIKRAYAGGANSYLRKPIDVGRFKPMVQQIISYWQLNERDKTIFEGS